MSVSISSEVAQRRSRVAVKVRQHAADSEVADARRDLAEANIAAYIERVVSKAPPLTDLQRQRLARLLKAGAA